MGYYPDIRRPEEFTIEEAILTTQSWDCQHSSATGYTCDRLMLMEKPLNAWCDKPCNNCTGWNLLLLRLGLRPTPEVVLTTKTVDQLMVELREEEV